MKFFRILFLTGLLVEICFLAGPQSARAGNKLLLFAAASTANAVQDIAKEYEKETGIEVMSSFASSSILSKQIANGAPADLFISAHPEWMDYLETQGKIRKHGRRNLVSNRLVLIVPKGRRFHISFDPEYNFQNSFQGRLAMGDPDHVPAGMYGKEALISLGWWEGLSRKIIRAMDVRAALNFVDQGEVDAGIVYSSDAKNSNGVEELAVFPEHTHTPITYPAGIMKRSSQSAQNLFDYLFSEQAYSVFSRYGFSKPRE